MASPEPTQLDGKEKRLGGVEEGSSESVTPDAVRDHGEECVPEGGFRAWATVLGGFLVQFCGFAYCTSFGVFQDYYTRIYLSDASPSAISWIGSISAFLSIALSLVTGPLYDRGYFYHLLYSGCFLMAFSLFMTSLAQPNQVYQVFLAQGVGYGLGSGLTYLPTVAVVSQHFKRRQSLAMILVHSGSSVGSIVHPIMLNKLLGNPKISFATTVRASAGLNTGLLVIACLLIRQGKGGHLPAAEQKRKPHLVEVVKKCVRDVPFAVFALSSVTFATGIWFPGFYLQLSAIMHGVDPSFCSYIFTIMNAVGLIGTLLPTLMLNRIRIDFTFICSAIVIASTVFAMMGLEDLASTAAITVLFGFFIGSYFSLQAPMVARLTQDHSQLGARLGIAFTFGACGALIGPPIHGALLTDRFIWWRPAVFSGIFSLLGALGFATLPILIRRRKQSKEKL